MSAPDSLDAVFAREREFHDRLAAELDAAAMPPQPPDPWEQAVLAGLGDVRGKHVLDVGCGDGNLTLHLLSRGARVTGLDLSPGMVEVARQRVALHAPDGEANFVVSPLETADLPEAGFDGLAGKFVLHHMDVDTAPAQLARLLVPGGVGCFIETSAENHALIWVRDHLVGRPGVRRLGTEDEHPLTREQLERFGAGFTRYRVDHPVMYLAMLVDRQVLHFRFKRVTKALWSLDQWLWRKLPRARRLSYYAALYIER